MSEPRFIVGIDLGTTNSVVAYTEANWPEDAAPPIRIMEIPQYVGPGAIDKRPLLPSFMLVPGSGGEPVKSTALPWDDNRRVTVGEYARQRGAEIPGYLISSSKSWLCNPMVDRDRPILPWGDLPDEVKLSPVEASATILSHIRDAWDRQMGAEDPGLRLTRQEVLLTVPASFDAVARELTVQAAGLAGLEQITLLEEPQAAFYAWISATGNRWRDQVNVDDRILVCDVGGGTCDLSLIRVCDEGGQLGLERMAVGNHLLVGGDNMDLALAYEVEKGLAARGTRLDARQILSLRHSCRDAKEHLLSGKGGDNYPISVLGGGGSLIGGTIRTELTRRQVADIVVDGFLPRCEPWVKPARRQTAGIREIGLSYESDPAITHHLAQFLGRAVTDDSDNGILPDAVLFNGGVMSATLLRRRIMDMFAAWSPRPDAPPVRRIDTHDFDLAVARGAVYYGLARRGRGIRIRSGLGRSYYLGVAASLPAVPGMPAPMKALCVAPFGMEEGTRLRLEGQEFVLVVGEPVSFDFLGSATRRRDQMGAVVDHWDGDIEPITTLETTLDGEKGSVIPVTMAINVTEVGTLELWCESRADGRQWKLEFNVRHREG